MCVSAPAASSKRQKKQGSLPLTCPDCHGALGELDDENILRYRCHVGHAFTAESLNEGQSEMLEVALWSAVRALENKRFSTMNKELQDANEELQAANEELQATNDELETNNEELQATNEELQTTNDELTARTAELQEVAKQHRLEQLQLASVLERYPHYIMVLHADDLTFQSINPTYKKLLGPRDVNGLPMSEVFNGRQVDSLLKTLKTAVRESATLNTGPIFASVDGDNPDTVRFG